MIKLSDPQMEGTSLNFIIWIYEKPSSNGKPNGETLNAFFQRSSFLYNIIWDFRQWNKPRKGSESCPDWKRTNKTLYF